MIFNLCEGCIGEPGCNCCSDIFLVLNPDEVDLFRNHATFFKVEGGGILYTSESCPFFKQNNCQIHGIKPLYCKYYPVFITGQPYIDKDCPLHSDYELTEGLKKEITVLQRLYPIYRKEWLWKDVKRKFNLENDEGSP